MNKNPFLKIPYKINRKLYNNTAALNYNISSYDYITGENVIKTFSRTIFIDNPKRVSSFIVDNDQIKADDSIIHASYLDILNSRESMNGDPVVTVNGVVKTLKDLRPWDIKSGGIVREADTLIFCGVSYQFKNIDAIDFYANTPTQYTFQLREGT